MLTSDIIRRVKEIQVRTGRQVADVLAGEYISVFKGGGVEFDEVRPYVPGDDVRTIDWNVTARSGEPYVKRFQEERQLTLMLMADVSASQDFGSGSRSKREATAELCALLAFSAIRNDDKVGLVLFHGGIEQYIPPRKGQKHALRVVREVLAHGETPNDTSRPHRPGTLPHPSTPSRAGSTRADRSTPAEPRPQQTGPNAGYRQALANGWRRCQTLWPWMTGTPVRPARQSTDIGHAMEFLMSVSKRKTVCFVVSDFFDHTFERAIMAANRKHDVIAVLISDPREQEIPDVGLVTLRDAEHGQTRLYDTGSKAFRDHVAQAGAQRIHDLERRLRAGRIDFIHIDASGSVVDPLVRFFRMRERRKQR